ncbi:SET domain-containing protein [Dentipellis sp. KUC8613]|nr:SET domain-containing protein [Dentipellis sp. KUC8613]
MSFSDLKSGRQSKQSKSFVKSITNSDEAFSSSALVHKTIDKDAEAARDESDLYKTVPSYLEIKATAERGRGVFAKEGIKRGSIVLAMKPHVHVLATRNLDSFCSACVSPAPEAGLKRCTRCKVVSYCGAACQNSDWTIHKKECGALQRWAAGAPSPDVAIPAEPIRCLGRVLWKKQKEGLKSVFSREIDALISHRTTLPESSYEHLTHLAHSVIRYLGLNAPGELGAFGMTTAADIVDLMSRFTTNSITLTTPSLTPVGVSVSPPIALINHSCDPNAVVVYPRANSTVSLEPLMQVIAIRDIAPGEEVFTAYIDTTLPRIQRQQALESAYNFKCQCSLCAGDWNNDPREALQCPKSCGGLCPLPTEEDPLTRCNKCKAVVSSTDSVLDALRVGQEALDKATALQSQDTPKALQLTTNIIPILTSSGLHPSSHPLLSLTRLHQALLLATFPPTLTQIALDNVIRASSVSLTGISAILCPGHPIRALALAELGKLLAVDEPAPAPPSTAANAAFPPSGAPRLQLARDTLVRAHEELRIAFGEKNEGGEVGREVREILVRIENELGAWTQGVRNVVADTPKVKKGAAGK